VLPEFVEFYERLPKHKVKLFVISNQPDVKRNLLESNELTLMDQQLKRQFSFDEIVYCTHDDSDCCECRKPKPGMIISLLQKHGLQRDRAIFVGDSKKDVGAGKAAGVTTVYVRRGYNPDAAGAEFTVDSLREILDIVTFVDR
jgi:D-glycero-D-manno-heptose 1,7-bisphosphate phosphatase